MESKAKKWLLIIGVGLIIAWIASIPVVLVSIFCGYHEQAGTFGDAFGYLNTLVSIVGFGAVVYTLHKQDEAGKEEKARHNDNLRLQNSILNLQQLQLRYQDLENRHKLTSSQLTEFKQHLQDFLDANIVLTHHIRIMSNTNPDLTIVEYIDAINDIDEKTKLSQCISMFPIEFDVEKPVMNQLTTFKEVFSSRHELIRGGIQECNNQLLNIMEEYKELANQQHAQPPAPAPPASPEP